MATSAVEFDALPFTFNEVDKPPRHTLDPILDKLKIDDYRSIFFLLLDVKIERHDFLKVWVKKNANVLKNKFICIYNESLFKDALLIELFGTMQRFDLLKLLGTCCHVFAEDKETFTQLKQQWKFLYTLCEQFPDAEIDSLKEVLSLTNSNVCCAEELMCLAFVKGKLEENNFQRRLEENLKFHASCSEIIRSYKWSLLKYYPVRRPTRTTHCGIAVIVNHVKFDMPELHDRPESNFDATALEILWKSFGFKTIMLVDLTALEVFQAFQKLAEEDHSKYDVFVACYLSHGDEGIVVAKDGTANELSVLVDLIANKCESLVGKPKLFFVQACQGPGIQTGFNGPVFIPETRREFRVLETRASEHSANVGLLSDVLVFKSSIEGFVSFRDGRSSWFISALVSHMEKDGDKLLLSSILNKVCKDVNDKIGAIKNSNITKCKQTPIWNSTLKHELKLKRVPSCTYQVC